MDELTNQWKKAKENLPTAEQSMPDLITKSLKQKQQILFAHYGTIIILTITLLLISFFFIYHLPFRDDLSRAGVILMTGGLFIRIVVELFSVIKSKNIDLSKSVSDITANALSFYEFRKKIHGPFTITIVVLYILGFYMLTPEFSKYISLTWMIIMCVSVIPISVILIWQIKKGIREEMTTLHQLTQISTQINRSDDLTNDDIVLIQ